MRTVTPPLTADRLLTSLDPDQRAAAYADDRHLWISAAAGTGKTRTLLARLVRIVRLQRVPAQAVVGITFTRAAARELGERLVECLGDEAGLVQLSTVQAYALRLLRAAFKRQGVPNLQPCDEHEADEILRSLYAGGRKLTRTPCSIHDARRFIRIAQREGLRHRSIVPEGHQIIAAWLQRLHEARVIPHAMIVPVVVNDGVGPYVEEIERVQAVLVDEAQDLAPVEHAFVAMHARASVTYVGDEVQGIFGWRGAGGLRETVSSPGWRHVYLRRVYRHGPEILAFADASAARGCDLDRSATLIIERAQLVADPGRLGVAAVYPGRDGMAPCDLVSHAISAAREAACEVHHLPLGAPLATAVLTRTRRQAELVASWGLAALVQAPTSKLIDLIVALGRTLLMPGDSRAVGRVLTLCGWDPDAVERVRLSAGRRRTLLDELRLPHYATTVAAGKLAVVREILALPFDAAPPDEMPLSAVTTAANRLSVELGEPLAVVREAAVFIAGEGLLATPLPDALEALAGEMRNEGRGWDAVTAQGLIGVGTMHGAKGREWPAVVVVRDTPAESMSPDEARVLHVAQTRARDAVVEIELPRAAWEPYR